LAAVQKTADPTEERILNFKHKMIQNLKSSETLSLDSAVWYLEAALNYSYDEPSTAEIIKIDSVFINVPISENGTISFEDVTTAYNELDGGVNTIFNETAGTDLDLQVADVSLKENTDTEATLQLTVAISDKLPNITSFGNDAYWHAGFLEGKCGIYEGQFVGRDATTELTRVANNSKAIPAQHGYFTNIVTTYYGGYEVGNEEYFFSAIGLLPAPDKTPCIQPNEMNHWLNQLKIFANIKKPANKMLITYRVILDFPTCSECEYWYLYHGAELSYGIWHSNTIPTN